MHLGCEKKTMPITREQIKKYNSGDIISFLEEQFILEDGKPIRLEEWQKEKILKPIFYEKDVDRLRKYNLALIMLTKKSGKSTLAAGVSLYMLFHDTDDAEVYGIAGDLEQARIIFQKTKKAVMRNPNLREAVSIYKDAIELKNGNGIIVSYPRTPPLHTG